MSEPRVISVQFVLRVTFSDDTVIEGKVPALFETLHNQEDARLFETLNTISGDRTDVQESIFTMMANVARQKIETRYTMEGELRALDVSEQCIEDARFQRRLLLATKADADPVV